MELHRLALRGRLALLNHPLREGVLSSERVGNEMLAGEDHAVNDHHLLYRLPHHHVVEATSGTLYVL